MGLLAAEAQRWIAYFVLRVLTLMCLERGQAALPDSEPKLIEIFLSNLRDCKIEKEDSTVNVA